MCNEVEKTDFSDILEPIKIEEEQSSKIRSLKGPANYVVFSLSVGMSLFVIWSNSFGIMLAMKQTATFLGFLLSLTFLLFPATKKSPRNYVPLYDWFFSILGMSCGLYILFAWDAFVNRRFGMTIYDMLFAAIAVILVLEGSRRTVGNVLPILAIIFLLYGYYGPYIPGILGHAGLSIKRILMKLYMVDEGLFGVTLRASSTFIFLFILLGVFLTFGGVGDFINKLSLIIAGKAIGGPAKVAVIASGLMGTISGSAVANVATTGTFTIPLMKKTGFSPVFAGAVEATASTGGMIMPPVMGAAAFIMAEFLSLPYRTIMYAAMFPAICYFSSVYFAVHFESKRLKLTPIETKLPSLWTFLKKDGVLILPIFLLIIVLLTGRTPTMAAFYSILLVLIISWFRAENKIDFIKFFKALEQGAKESLSVCMACAVVGIVVGITTSTDLGAVVGNMIVNISKQSILIALLVSAISCIILSMGLPGTALYIIGATVIAPALLRLGAIPLAAHFFVFYWGCLSNITPPVALASYTAGGIAGADPMKVGYKAFVIAIPSFIIPFSFVLEPAMLLQAGDILLSMRVFITALIGCAGMAIAVVGYFNTQLKMWERFIFAVGSIATIYPSVITDVIGFALLLIGFLSSIKRIKRQQRC